MNATTRIQKIQSCTGVVVEPAPEPDRAEGTNTGHEDGEAMASVGVRVEPTVRL